MTRARPRRRPARHHAADCRCGDCNPAGPADTRGCAPLLAGILIGPLLLLFAPGGPLVLLGKVMS